MANLKIVITINILIVSPINIPIASIAWAIGRSINIPVAWVIACPIGSSIWAVDNLIGSPIGNPIGLAA